MHDRFLQGKGARTAASCCQDSRRFSEEQTESGITFSLPNDDVIAGNVVQSKLPFLDELQ